MPRGWERPEATATPEAMFRDRRGLAKTLAAGPIPLAAPALLAGCDDGVEIAAAALDERLYRHRCVEAWSMDVPWSGFPLKALVELARPLSAARYPRFSGARARPDAAV